MNSNGNQRRVGVLRLIGRAWMRLGMTNPVKSNFAGIHHHTDRAKGRVTRKTVLVMICQLAESVEKRWRRIRGFNHFAKVIEVKKNADSRNAAGSIQ